MLLAMMVSTEPKFDIIAGTSIGAINRTMIAGSKNDDPAKDLEDF